MNVTPGGLRLARLLQLIPFLQSNSGVSISDTAQLFEISEEQLISDLNLIWLCGLPGYSHLELIDVSYDSGFISVRNAETLARPMRLGFDEGSSLLLAIESLLVVVPPSDSHVLKNLRSKILHVLQLENESQIITPENSATPTDSSVLPTIIQAIDSGNQTIDLHYYSATLDSSIRTQIIPKQISAKNGFTYLLALTVPGGEYSTFRVDRIERACLSTHSFEIGSLQASPPNSPEVAMDTPALGVVEVVEVELAPDAYWFIEKWGLSNLKYVQERDRYVGQIEVFDPSWLIRAALSLAGALEVVAPTSLREQVARAARSSLERYLKPLK